MRILPRHTSCPISPFFSYSKFSGAVGINNLTRVMQCSVLLFYFTGSTPMQDQILISANQTWPVNVILPEAESHAHTPFQCDWTQVNICWNADCCASLIVTES